MTALAPLPRVRVRPAPGPAGPDPLLRGHLHQVDMVRVLTFAAVVAVHATGAITPYNSVTGNAVQILLHATRESFFALAAFVLFFQHYRLRPHQQPLNVVRFWRRRLWLVGLPFVVWTLAYGLPTFVRLGWAGPQRFGYDLLTGDARYHLYFLLVSLQLYLLFPALRGLVRRTEGHHGTLLAVSAVAQVAILYFVQYGPSYGGAAGLVLAHAHELFPTYQLWFVIGALAAVHLEAVHGWLTGHTRAVLAALVVAAGITEFWYGLAVAHGQLPSAAAAVFQPVMVLWCPAVLAALYVTGVGWARRRRPGRVDAAVRSASDSSFGIYLVHPAVLALVVPLTQGLYPPLWTAAAVSVTLVVSWLLVLAVRRTPLSPALAGRPRAPR